MAGPVQKGFRPILQELMEGRDALDFFKTVEGVIVIMALLDEARRGVLNGVSSWCTEF